MPFDYLYERYLPFVIKEGINPEISFSCFTLDTYARDDFRRVADALGGAALAVTLHAPFMDLRPGAIDPMVRRATVDRFRQVFDLAPLFHPKSIVCHPSFDERYYVSTEREWLENSLETWRKFLPLMQEIGAVISFENVYEGSPGILQALLESLDSPCAGICFDTGHFNVFSKSSLNLWTGALGRRIGQLHLHDNHGGTDEHLPVGEGSFPFRDFFSTLKGLDVDPILTVEPHTEENLRKTLENIERLGLLEILRG